MIFPSQKKFLKNLVGAVSGVQICPKSRHQKLMYEMSHIYLVPKASKTLMDPYWVESSTQILQIWHGRVSTYVYDDV